MSKKINNRKGQTALILILLAAAALIFLSITLNWGHIAQQKSLLTVAADQSASLLASDAASFGEMQKQSDLKDTNQISQLSGILLDVLALIVAIVALVYTGGLGATWIAGHAFLYGLAIASVALATLNLVLQLAVIQPGENALWNGLQKNQPTKQQFYEQGISTALQGSVTDRVSIIDYFDSNANGQYGLQSNDTLSRFGFFYSDRLKMLNPGDIPQLVFFYNELGYLNNGETCQQNYNENLYHEGVPLNPSCIDPASKLDYCSPFEPDPTGINCTQVPQNPVNCAQIASENSLDPLVPLNPACPMDCVSNPSSPACQSTWVPNEFSFQLNSSCTDSDPQNASYNPYCDPCCQQLLDSNNKTLRPSSCSDRSAVPAQCIQNNPYGSSYPFLYDPSFQELDPNGNALGASFLAQFGRDQQMIPPTPHSTGILSTPSALPLTVMSALGQFPSGIYHFFWRMNNYSPQVDNITDPTKLQDSQVHWCDKNGNGVIVPRDFTPPTSGTLKLFPDLAQMILPYSCTGQDCCVNSFDNNIINGVPALVTNNNNGQTNYNTITNGPIDLVGEGPPMFPNNASNPAQDTSFGEQGNPWLAGDNQMCTTTWAYNGSTSSFPDGTCEWTNSTSAPTSTGIVPSSSTLDSLDDTMHTLSDFAVYAKTFTNEDISTLNSSFDSWFPQAASWIGTQCSCSEGGFFNSFNLQCDASCNPGGLGRLLSVYAPPGYPGITGVPTDPNPTDRLNNWYNLITKWLGNSYTLPSSTSSNVWCVPEESALEVPQNGSMVPSNEDSFIKNNSGTSTWGDLSHVVSCLNYNAGPTPSQLKSSSYAICLAALTPGALCPATLPAACAPSTLGPALNPAAATVPVPPYDGCIGQYAAWVKNALHFGPIYNFTNCQTAMAINSSNAQPLQCIPSLLGRSLVGPSPAWGSSLTGNYATWVNNSLLMAKDEQIKFVTRLEFLSDVLTQAQTMQNIFSSGDVALHNFLKTCTGCAEGTCSKNKCSDGSSCGSPLGECEDGGPAAQLIYAQSHANTTPPLPNSVVYGWQDSVPEGGSGGCFAQSTNSSPGAPPPPRVGCSHIVKVTAYSPGRQGNVSFAQSKLPIVHGWTSDWGFVQNYTLQYRDGYVYVSIQRWDQNHSSVNFPNGHTLWQSVFQNPNPAQNQGLSANGLPTDCFGLPSLPGNSTPTGYGLRVDTINGLQAAMKQTGIDPVTSTVLAQAFMLNDSGNGSVDVYGSGGGYGNCIKEVNALLDSGVESHACAEYIASSNANEDIARNLSGGGSGTGEQDYTLKFVNCNSIDGGNPPQSKP